ncbi:MAG: starch-binding protein [Haliscomenobacter sp.]|nr:starch-binding protein [Haliscomenobacter sp.]
MGNVYSRSYQIVWGVVFLLFFSAGALQGQTPAGFFSWEDAASLTEIIDATGFPAALVVLENATDANGFTVYFKKPSTWNSPVKIHYWNNLPGNSATTWPGVAMTQCGLIGDWWSYTFTGTTSTNLLFHDGAGKQTPTFRGVRMVGITMASGRPPAPVPR